MGLLGRFLRKKEDDDARIVRLLSSGRIVEGRILDLSAEEESSPVVVFYSYNVQGVEYESSQTLNSQQQSKMANYSPGARVIIRYDQRQPANSIIV